MKDTLAVEIKELAKKLLATNGSFDTLKVKDAVAQVQEKLTVLAYLESQLRGATNRTSQRAVDAKSVKKEQGFKAPEKSPKSVHARDLVKPLMEKNKDNVAQRPPESQHLGRALKDTLPKKKHLKNELEEFASNYKETPTFERKFETAKKGGPAVVSEQLEQGEAPAAKKAPSLNEDPNAPKSLNESLNKGWSIGLNDRLAFIKNLFEGDVDDYQRVLSQVNTFQSLEEASLFITSQVQPDYKGWPHKEEYVERFMGIVEKKFS